jgi:hypothetical protein
MSADAQTRRSGAAPRGRGILWSVVETHPAPVVPPRFAVPGTRDRRAPTGRPSRWHPSKIVDHFTRLREVDAASS